MFCFGSILERAVVVSAVVLCFAFLHATYDGTTEGDEPPEDSVEVEEEPQIVVEKPGAFPNNPKCAHKKCR